MACDVRTVKLSLIGLSCLQKLISHDAVSPSALKEILSTLKDVSLDKYMVSNFQYFNWILHFLVLSCLTIYAVMTILLPSCVCMNVDPCYFCFSRYFDYEFHYHRFMIQYMTTLSTMWES